MIYFLYGPNTYEADHALTALLEGLAKKYPEAAPERIDAGELEISQLPDLLQGTSLFAERRIIVLRSPSGNKPLWNALADYAGTVADSTDLIIVDAGADKRTKTFKTLQKAADSHEYPEFGPKNTAAIYKWIEDESKRRGVDLPRASAELLIERVGYDQWSLANAMSKLALVGDTGADTIRDLIEASPNANALELFEAALRRDADRVRIMLTDLQQTNDPHALVGLLATQAYYLALTAYGTKTVVETARAAGLKSPYPLQKLSPITRQLTKTQVIRAINAITECDRDLKRSVAPPWTLITRSLLKIST